MKLKQPEIEQLAYEIYQLLADPDVFFGMPWKDIRTELSRENPISNALWIAAKKRALEMDEFGLNG